MKLLNSVLTAVLASVVSVAADCQNVGGNYYCSKTSKVTFPNLGFSGLYQDITNMDENLGSCSTSKYPFSGTMSPLDEELSVHFRGPLKLLQFGVYYPSASANQKRDEECTSTVQHAHHKHKRATEVVQVTQIVTVDGNGNPVTTQATAAVPTSPAGNSPAGNSPAGNSPAGNSPAGSSPAGNSPAANSPASSSPAGNSPAPSAASSSAGSLAPVPSGAPGSWLRVSYYTPGNTDNVTFCNNYGGSGSGVWSSQFGNSISYANLDASGGSSSPVALEETIIPSNTEFMIFSSTKCSGDSCGYYREGIPAYHGFGGADKIFVFEFEMPTATDSVSFNHDMPAIWLLNAKIPRTLQYGKESCSCWSSGCGELDLFEILSAGEDRLIAHLHDAQGTNNQYGGGGSSDYFQRPTSGSMKAAVVFQDGDVSIVEVDDDFAASLDADTVLGWVGQSGSKASIGY